MSFSIILCCFTAFSASVRHWHAMREKITCLRRSCFQKDPLFLICVCVCVCVCARARVCVCVCAQLCPSAFDPMDYSPPVSSVHGIQARRLEWVVFPPPGDLPGPRIEPTSPASQGILCRWATSYFYWLIFPSPDGFQNTYHLVSLLGETSLLSFFHESLLVTQNNRGLHNTLVYVRCIFVVILPRDYKQIPCHIHWHFFAIFAKTR